jgi:transcriptional regulator with XRE-family HTH domain
VEPDEQERGVANAEQIKEFLTSRRAKVTPDQVGLPVAAGNRRVPGLRREEVAVLANVSLEYYTRIERGTATGVSETVLDAVAQALQLSDAERTHLFDLMRAERRTTPRRRQPPPRQRVRDSVVNLLEGMPRTPAVIHDHRLDILASNPLARALFDPLYADPVRPVNYARFLFLDRHAQDFWVDWNDAANNTVAILRGNAGANPHDTALNELIGELSARTREFATRWAAHDVRQHTTTHLEIHHPEVGLLEFNKEVLDLPDEGQSLAAYIAQPDTHTADSLELLASWTLANNPPHDDQPAPQTPPSPKRPPTSR